MFEILGGLSHLCFGGLCCLKVIPALNVVYTFLTGALVDSIETLEREYVVVTADNLMMSLSASGVGQYPGKETGGSPQKIANSPYMATTGSGGGVGSGGSNASVPSHSSQDSVGDRLEGPSLHPPTRLSSLKRCAQLISDVANDKVWCFPCSHVLSSQLIHSHTMHTATSQLILVPCELMCD